MKKNLVFVLFIFISIVIHAQEDTYPIYTGCENTSGIELENCFNQKLTKEVLSQIKLPKKVLYDNYKGTLNVVFLVTKEGNFDVIYIRSIYKELEDEVRRVFSNLPKVAPATYNGRAIDMRFGMPINIPLGSNLAPEAIKEETKIVQSSSTNIKKPEEDIFDAVTKLTFPEHKSQLNIPLVHSTYNELDYYYSQDNNSHTTSKPYIYSEASNYINLDNLKKPLFKNKSSKAGKKFWNEHLFSVQEKDFWFTVNPVFDLQLGKDNSDNVDYTYNNTRGIQIQGGIGKKLSFNTSFYESQGRFANYVNRFASENNPLGAAGTVPGRGKGKRFKTDALDYPVAEAYLSYTPNKTFNFQFGNGKNFIGDGYRSFMVSDAAAPYTFLKINTKFWKIKYTNLWMWIDDVRPQVSVNNARLRKYIAIHHLSWNVNKRLNFGLFEAVITNNEGGNGFDINFFNPIIFYRAVEFTRGSESGNALIGLNSKYKLTDDISIYSQFILDELTVSRFFDGDGYWGNKFAFQLGAKYHNAFKVDNLFLQGEFNLARPYTFSHFGNGTLNYGHFNQPIGHLWGSNFWEAIGIAQYRKGRWFANAKLILGQKGFDIDNISTSYGGDIYASNDNRIGNTGVDIGQGNKTDIFIGDLQIGYTLNPTTNLKLFTGLTLRNFDPLLQTTSFNSQNTTWFTVGLKTDIFNWYFDF